MTMEDTTETTSTIETASTTHKSSSTAVTSTTLHSDDPHPITSAGNMRRKQHRDDKDDNDDDAYSSDEDDDDDEETLARQNAFRQAANARPCAAVASKDNLIGATGVVLIQTHDEKGNIVSSLRRFDELGDFRTRSERTRSEREGGRCSATSIHTGSLVSHADDGDLLDDRDQKHKVKFLPEDMFDVDYIPELTQTDKHNCYMTSDNWNSIDMDVELTRKRYENHTLGAIRFDTEKNSLRGLETMFMTREEEVERGRMLRNHQRSLLTEQNKLRQEYESANTSTSIADEWMGRLRKVSLQTSKDQLRKARGRAIYDANECAKMWNVTLKNDPLYQRSTSTNSTASNTNSNTNNDDEIISDHERFTFMDVIENFGPDSGKNNGKGAKNGKDNKKENKPNIFKQISKVFGGGDKSNKNKK